MAGPHQTHDSRKPAVLEMTGDAGDRHPVHMELALGESEAFLVDDEDGTEVGVVDRVLFGEGGRVAGIEVRVGWIGRRRWTFSSADVVAVRPARRRLVVSHASVARNRTAVA